MARTERQAAIGGLPPGLEDKGMGRLSWARNGELTNGPLANAVAWADGEEAPLGNTLPPR